jgi:hypothetical protein
MSATAECLGESVSSRFSISPSPMSYQTATAEDIRSMFGDDVTMMSLPRGSKKPSRKWEPCSDDQKLNKGNIAILLGAQYGNIISIDLDDDESFDEFVRINSHLPTFISRGSRGGNIWFKVDGECPKLQDLTHKGRTIGEFRGSGGYTVVSGKHPDGNDYVSITEKVATIQLGKMKWIDGAPITEHIQMSTRGPDKQINRIPDKQMVRCMGESKEGVGAVDDMLKVALESVSQFKATKQGITHILQFNLARRILKIEKESGSKFSPIQLMEIGKHWYRLSKDHLRNNESEHDYMMMFIERYKTAHTPEGMTIEAAWEKSKCFSSHPLMKGTPDSLQSLQKLCRELTEMSNKKRTFHLGGGQVANLMNYKGSEETRWKRGRRDIAALEAFGVIKKQQVGHSGKNNTYEYLLDDLNIEGKAA